MATRTCKWCGSSYKLGFLASNTMGLAGNSGYCSKKCETDSSGNQQGGSNNEGSGNTTVINKGDGFLTSMGKSFTDSKKDDKEKMENKIDQVTSMIFGTNVEEISNQLNILVSIGSANNGKAQPDKSLKNAIVEKMEFGIMKLKTLNANAEADFFEKKLEPLKKKKWF